MTDWSPDLTIVSEFYPHEDVDMYVGDWVDALVLAWLLVRTALFRKRQTECFDSEGEGYSLRVEVRSPRDHPAVIRPWDCDEGFFDGLARGRQEAFDEMKLAITSPEFGLKNWRQAVYDYCASHRKSETTEQEKQG